MTEMWRRDLHQKTQASHVATDDVGSVASGHLGPMILPPQALELPPSLTKLQKIQRRIDKLTVDRRNLALGAAMQKKIKAAKREKSL